PTSSTLSLGTGPRSDNPISKPSRLARRSGFDDTHGDSLKGRSMGLDFAVDELYATGWSDLDSIGFSHHTDGRGYPKPDRVTQEFASAGFRFATRRIDLFNCYRAEWFDTAGDLQGAVVGYCEAEAAVYALAQFRRQQLAAAVA